MPTIAIILVLAGAALVIFALVRKVEAEKPPPTVYTCPYCGAEFATEAELNAHIKAEHPDEPQVWTCPFCGATFDSEIALAAHIAAEHPDEPPTPPEEITYFCPYCLATLGSLSEFFNHLERVHFQMPEDYFYCPYCGDDFSTMAAFFSHLEAEHIDDITAPPILPPGYLKNLSVDPPIVRQGEDATISGSFVGPFPDAYTKYRLAFHCKGRTRPRAYGKITSAGAFSLTLPTAGSFSVSAVSPGTYLITTTCAYRHDPPGGPILERTIWLNAPTGLIMTIIQA